MIIVEYRDTDNRCAIHLTGHAGAAEIGKDLVCAASTGLAWALRESLEKFCDDFTSAMKPGNILISAAKNSDTEARFSTIMEGYRWLAQNYPEYVRIN
ncbi:MAG: ribosomal-processing cysteine protease Prp [Bilifractor sp.]